MWEFLRNLFGNREVDADARRWIVVDTETTGLNPDRDSMLSIGGVAIADGRLELADSFEMVVYAEGPVVAENVLVHGIGHELRAAGVPLEEAIPTWRSWRDGAPAIAFHAEFDRRMLRTAVRRAGLEPDPRPWLDVAHLGEALDPEFGDRPRSLDEWLEHASIPIVERHSAAADALATAQLLMKLLPEASRRGVTGLPALRRMARRHHRRRAAESGGA